MTYVLTDGAPSAGEHQTRTEILSEVAWLNRYRKAVIHTVEIAPDATGKRWRGFMADLAARNGGCTCGSDAHGAPFAVMDDPARGTVIIWAA